MATDDERAHIHLRFQKAPLSRYCIPVWFGLSFEHSQVLSYRERESKFDFISPLIPEHGSRPPCFGKRPVLTPPQHSNGVSGTKSAMCHFGTDTVQRPFT